MLDSLVLYYKDNKPKVTSYNLSMFITLWDIKELTHYTQRVGHGVTGVVVCFSVTYYGLGGQSLRDITFSKLLLNSRVHSAHAIHQLANEKRDCKIPVIVTI